MIDFIKGNVGSIACVMLLVFSLAMLYKAGKKETVRKIILGLVVRAEKALGSGTGELKYAWVVQELYSVMPALLRFLFSQSDIDKMISDGVEKLKKYLESGITLTGYDEEKYIETLSKNSEAQ